uniref:Proline rich bombesin-related protein n=1 Tax=Bombina maxima TaxID=161274 RepID=Q8QFP2_BOMMX|nr:proline rich bombesin-related protein precursor [Bombina maxima]
MSAIPLNRILPLGFLFCLLLSSFISLSSCMEFVEDANNQGRISLQKKPPRPPQWAVGHFMGKKSLQDMDFEEMGSFAKRSVEKIRAALLQEQQGAGSERELRHAQLVAREILAQYLENMQN